jgi:hypothetical protein
MGIELNILVVLLWGQRAAVRAGGEVQGIYRPKGAVANRRMWVTCYIDKS